jgi:hypothetical protein
MVSDALQDMDRVGELIDFWEQTVRKRFMRGESSRQLTSVSVLRKTADITA